MSLGVNLMDSVNFIALFAKDGIERLSFQTRKDSNFGHNLIFLSFYLHDAKFSPHSLVLNDNIVEFDLHRACWACYLRPGNAAHHLPACKSRLRFSEIHSSESSTSDAKRIRNWFGLQQPTLE